MFESTAPALRHLHLVSDSTGDTVTAVTKAAASLFPGLAARRHLHAFVRTPSALADVAVAVSAAPGPVFYTLVDPGLIEALERHVRGLGVECIDVLGPAAAALSRLTGRLGAARPGSQHALDQAHFDRVAAIDYAIGHDDGLSAGYLSRADVILIGVSRTSKTPTCIYLAYQGLRAANVPLLPGQAPPAALLDALAAGVPGIGLTASPQRLAQIRAQRLETLGMSGAEGYAELDALRREVSEARLFFDRLGVPVIDVTRRSIEETAAAVRQILQRRAPV